MKTRGWTGRGHKKIAVSPLSILNQNADGLVPSGRFFYKLYYTNLFYTNYE